MNGGILNRALEGHSVSTQVPVDTSTLKADVLRTEWLGLEFTQDFKKALEDNLALTSGVARSLALYSADTNKAMLIALVEQATLEKVLNLVTKGNYGR